MKDFLSKKKLINLITPDFFLSLILLGVAIRFAGEVPTWFDLLQLDDNRYMYGGCNLLNTSPALALVGFQIGPLFSNFGFFVYID